MRPRRIEGCGFRRSWGVLASACLTSGSFSEVLIRRCTRLWLD